MPCRTAGLIVQATTLHAEVAAVCAQSRALIERGRERRRFSAYPRLRPISGGSDAALVVMTITDATGCLPCIARNTGIPVEQVNGLLRTITRTLRLRIGPHRCDACLQHKTTFSVTKDGHPQRGRSARWLDLFVLRFLSVRNAAAGKSPDRTVGIGPRRGRPASFTAELRELAAAPPSAFVRTRNALVARLRKAGHNDQAKEVAARRRPTVVLWLTNQLALSEPAEIQRLLDASDRLRRAQLRDPGAVPEVTRQHRAALQHLMQRAEQILIEAGMHRSPEVLRRVQATLSAAAADRRTHVALRNGQLSEEVEAGGFDVLDGAPSSHLRLVTPPKGRTSAEATSAKPGRERKREERAQREAARGEAQTARREAAKVKKAKAEAARRQRSIERATRQADRLREQLRAVEARIEQERRPS